ncbi:hypothetical protein AFE_1718 [Acidithiobacillus ferrooxidans ATCC 23270]|uniref:Uncharacterized protein n=1 Tax=Acidithiobacillus ferrooxidans (strain ATCC 23270 / DSM 14882 / CIP 104768 / NCIMB 8455) TaxID=243159 RepID=B7JB54_ACIF2|nr:hypothetical protein AFE_1718 [Acidithiobacillus ferrooxidans ATCC 23270]
MKPTSARSGCHGRTDTTTGFYDVLFNFLYTPIGLRGVLNRCLFFFWLPPHPILGCMENFADTQFTALCGISTAHPGTGDKRKYRLPAFSQRLLRRR